MKLYLKNGKTISIKKYEAELIINLLKESSNNASRIFLTNSGVRYASITISEIAAIY